MTMTGKRTGISLFALAMAAQTPAWAQVGARDEAAAAQAGEGVIIVTAQRREQNLQDVPVVVSVLSQAQLQNAGVRDIKDLQTITPGLNASQSTSPAQVTFRIRGVGTIGDNPGLESSVGTVIDGVYRARSSVGFTDLGELERIEVLKGPQSTLFGKNTSAGVISVVTAKPSFDARGEATAGYGNYDAYSLSAYATGPIAGDSVAGSLFAIHRKRDGFIRVATGAGPRTERRDNDENYYSLRGQLLIAPGSDLELRLIADYSKREENCCVNIPTIVGPTGAYIDQLAPDAGITRPADPFARFTYANQPTPAHVKDYGVSAHLDYDLGSGLSLTSISAYRLYGARFGYDPDYSTSDVWNRPFDLNSNRFKVFSQEVRLAYDNGPLNLILGGYYSDERLRSKTAYLFGTAYERHFGLLLSAGANENAVSGLTGLPAGTNFVAGEGAVDRFRHVSKSAAVFADGSLTIADGVDLNLGLRYTDERKRLRSFFTNTAPAAACAAAIARGVPAAARGAICVPTADPAFDNATTFQTRKNGRLAGTAKLSWRVAPELMLYGSYANGFKSGGFNLDRARIAAGVINPDTSFEIEKVESYEIGAKTTLLNGRLLANIAGFSQTYTDFQLLTYTGVAFLVVTIPEVESEGVDFDLQWRTGIDGLTLNAGATYVDTRYGQFTPPPGISPRLPGNRLSFAAKWNLTAGFSSRQGISDGLDLMASASVKWTSRYNTGSNLDPLKIQPAYAFVNARIGLTPKDDAWSLELWAQNLTNANIRQVVIDQPYQAGTYGAYLGAPRTYGLTGRVRF